MTITDEWIVWVEHERWLDFPPEPTQDSGSLENAAGGDFQQSFLRVHAIHQSPNSPTRSSLALLWRGRSRGFLWI